MNAERFDELTKLLGHSRFRRGANGKAFAALEYIAGSSGARADTRKGPSRHLRAATVSEFTRPL